MMVRAFLRLVPLAFIFRGQENAGSALSGQTFRLCRTSFCSLRFRFVTNLRISALRLKSIWDRQQYLLQKR
jgi:hypothetical protein